MRTIAAAGGDASLSNAQAAKRTPQTSRCCSLNAKQRAWLPPSRVLAEDAKLFLLTRALLCACTTSRRNHNAFRAKPELPHIRLMRPTKRFISLLNSSFLKRAILFLVHKPLEVSSTGSPPPPTHTHCAVVRGLQILKVGRVGCSIWWALSCRQAASVLQKYSELHVRSNCPHAQTVFAQKASLTADLLIVVLSAIARAVHYA